MKLAAASMTAVALAVACVPQGPQPAEPMVPDYRWSDETDWDPRTACVGDMATGFDLCGWASNFEDLVVFGVDRVEIVDAPLFDYMTEETTPESCGRIIPGIRLHGRTLSAAHGTSTTELFAHRAWVENADFYQAGTKSLWRVVAQRDSVFIVEQPIPVVDNVITPRETSVRCGYAGMETIFLRPVDELQADLSECNVPGQPLSAMFLEGAYCEPPPPW